jgi:dihydrofolate reductase
MRRIRYSVAASLDGYIAGPNGEFDWIIMDPAIDFEAIVGQFDALLVGRGTMEVTSPDGDPLMGLETYLVSTTLKQEDYSQVSIVPDAADGTIAKLKEEAGKDIWLFGGGILFKSLADLGLVDIVEVAVIPILLGGGIPLYPAPSDRIVLELTDHRVYPTGIVGLDYSVKTRD